MDTKGVMQTSGRDTNAKKGGNDGGLAALDLSHDVASCWSFPPFFNTGSHAVSNIKANAATNSKEKRNHDPIQDQPQER
jgi:hypothetical protein